MSQDTIVLCFPASPEQVALISAQADRFGLRVRQSSQQSIGRDIMDATVFCGHAKLHPIDWPKVVEGGKLKWIQSSAAGLDHCLHSSVIASEILVSSCSGLFAHQVAEQTTALLFSLLRGLPRFFRAQGNREFVRHPTDEIRGKSVGIIGCGGNGQQIAHILRGFDCQLLATDLFPEEVQVDGLEPMGSDRLLELAQRSQILIAALPLCPGTNRLLNADFFAAARAGSYFVNVGRGATVDQDSLVAALQSGHLRGAGLDVVDPEPLPADSPLWDMENVIITPHVAAQSAFRVPATVELFCQNLGRYHSRQTLINLVDKELGFPRPQNRLICEGLR